MKTIFPPKEFVDTILVVTSNGHWGVYKGNSTRSTRNFRFRDQAFHYAALRFPEDKIIVFNKDGFPDFVHYDPSII